MVPGWKIYRSYPYRRSFQRWQYFDKHIARLRLSDRRLEDIAEVKKA
jgi:hypothetical protein